MATNLIEMLGIGADDGHFDIVGIVLELIVFLDRLKPVGVQNRADRLIQRLAAFARLTNVRIAFHHVCSSLDVFGEYYSLIRSLPIDVADLEAVALLDDLEIRDFIDALLQRTRRQMFVASD